MKALVTGGAGFIGSTLVDKLLELGHDVTVVDSFASGKMSNLTAARSQSDSRLDIENVDIRDAETVSVIEAATPDVVFHLAAQADVRVSVSDPILDAEINVLGSLHVLEGARRAGANKVVFASSGGTIYGEPDPSALPVSERHSQHPVSPYGVTKKVFTDYLHAYRELHGLDFTSCALANVYGPRQDPHGEAGVISIFAGKLISGDVCTIFGDGGQTRDFVFVDDVVDAFVRASTQGGGMLFNIGTGREISVLELYQSMAKAAGSPLKPTFAPSRVGELDRIALDTTLAKQHLGWSSWTAIDDGTQAVIDWAKTSDDE